MTTSWRGRSSPASNSNMQTRSVYAHPHTRPHTLSHAHTRPHTHTHTQREEQVRILDQQGNRKRAELLNTQDLDTHKYTHARTHTNKHRHTHTHTYIHAHTHTNIHSHTKIY